MGKGDRKSRRGKIARGSYGKSRPHKPSEPVTAAPPKPEVNTLE
ncbi:30S ribosomal protein THX [Spirosoma validum]|uniref:30S ribosomal protein THX n=1 Tax=Spirosoma validum TaxID=2771355 RepID=A0A927GGW2_9BACT|nr:30S ribosomal protein THX [Spirosoma validum]MBD2757301.1 30S ribosomal protein THX [Spirosoma validum]